MPALFLLLSLWLCQMIGCQKTESGTVHRGRLELDGICGNYTVRVLNQTLDTTQVQAQWTNPLTNTSYNDVFRVANPCQFPDALREGDTFEFRIITHPQGDCVQCMAYAPTPDKSLNIQVLTP